MTVFEKYLELKQKWEKSQNQEEYDSLGDCVVEYRDGHFTKEDWQKLIEQSHGRAKYEYTRMMNERFPDTYRQNASYSDIK